MTSLANPCKPLPRQKGRLIPRVVSEFNKNDVFMGSYSLPAEYEGNASFRQLLLHRRKDYLFAASRRAKHRITKEIVKAIHERGGRFLEMVTPDKGEAAWKIVDAATVLNQKVRQFMRDVGPETRKKRIMRRMEDLSIIMDKTASFSFANKAVDDQESQVKTVKAAKNLKSAIRAPPSPQNVFEIERISFEEQASRRSPTSDTQSMTSSMDEATPNASDLVSQDGNQHLLTLLMGLGMQPNQALQLQQQQQHGTTVASFLPSLAPPANEPPQEQQLLRHLVSMFGSTPAAPPAPQPTQNDWNSTGSQDDSVATLAALSLLISTLSGGR